MNDADSQVRLRPEPHSDFTVRLPDKALRLLERIAEWKGMSCEALARQYIGRGLAEDRMARFNETALQVTTEVLAEELGEERAQELVEGIRQRFRE